MPTTPSPATSGADGSDDAATANARSPVAAPEPIPPTDGERGNRNPRRRKKDPVEQRAAYLAKRREIKARARARQKHTATSLPQQHTLLQKQLTAALAAYHANTRAILHERLAEGGSERLVALWDAYVEALELHDAIARENQHLVDRINEFLRVECRLLLPEFHPNEEDAADTNDRVDEAAQNGRGYWTHFEDEVARPFYYAYYRPDESNARVADAYKRMQKDIAEASSRQWAFAAGCYGWQGYGNIDADDASRVRFQFRKTLTRASSLDLMDDMTRETSRIFHSPRLYGRLYSLHMESQVMQRVDDNTSVILQSMSDEHRFMTLRSFMLFSCVEERLPPSTATDQSRRATTIINVVIPPHPQEIVEPHDANAMLLYLTDCLIYMRLEQVDDHRLAVTYGGHAQCLSPELARLCVLESVSSFFRWVQLVIPERLVAFN